MFGAPSIITTTTRSRYERPPQGPFVLNRDSPAAQGLVSWWPLGDNNPRNYRDWHSQTERIQPNMTMVGTMGVALGPFGSGFATSNTGSTLNYLEVEVAAATALPMSFAAWYRPVSTSASYNLVAICDPAGATGGHYYSMLQNNTLAATVSIAVADNTGESEARSPAVAVANQWNFAVASIDSTTSRTIWLNGPNNTATNTTSRTVTGVSRTNLGIFHNNVGLFSPLNGRLSDCCVWNRGTTSAQVAYLYDPATRWDLYYLPNRIAYSFSDAVSPPPPPSAAGPYYYNQFVAQIGPGGGM